MCTGEKKVEKLGQDIESIQKGTNFVPYCNVYLTTSVIFIYTNEKSKFSVLMIDLGLSGILNIKCVV